MNDLFGGVIYTGQVSSPFNIIFIYIFYVIGIDTDKYKYPIGSGRVTFDNQRSYMKAVGAAFIEIKTAKFTKKVS